MKAFLARHAFAAVALVLAVVLGSVFAASRSSHSAALSSQSAQFARLKAKAVSLSSDRATAQRSADAQLLGTNATRVAADTVVIDSLLTRALTWTDHASYTAARTSMMAKYTLAPTSEFMTAFLPPDPTSTDAAGNSYSYIDALGLNSSVAASTISVLSVNGLTYSYMVRVVVSTSSRDSSATANRTSVVFLSTNGGGGVSGLSGYASVDVVRQSN